MTRETEGKSTLMSRLIEVISEKGFEGMSEVIRVLFNEAMKIERNEVLAAEPYERSEERLGYANGYKPKTLNTRMGSITVDIPQARAFRFIPKALSEDVGQRRR